MLISTQYAYNLDTNIYEAVKPGNTIETFLKSNPDFLSLKKDTSTLAEAKNYLTDGLKDLTAAIDWIEKETDDQNDDVINLLGVTDVEIAEAKKAIQVCLDTPDKCTVEFNDTENTDDDSIINLTKFFAGLDFRQPNLLPTFDGDTPGVFPDTTMGGVIVQGDINEDTDPADGIPDILQ